VIQWRNIASLFGRTRAQSLEADIRRTQAYQSVFRGSPTREDQEIVLSDLRSFTGFDKVSPASVSGEMLRQAEGKREAFARIWQHLSLSPADVLALENAARQDSALTDAI
jgi:hypothetical protein